jgi:Flp pilus assembly protein TadD
MRPIVKYELAAKLDIRSSKPYEQIAALQFRQSRFGEALEAQRLAVRRQPGSGVQRMKLAEAYEAAGQTAEAAAERKRAAALLAETITRMLQATEHC